MMSISQQRTLTPISELSVENAKHVLELNDSLNWTFTNGDVETIFASGHIFGTYYGQLLVGCAACFEIGSSAISIGAVMVHPSYRRRGIGKQLMEFIHERYDGNEAVFRLVATDEGVPLYDALGYATVTRFNKMTVPMPWRLNGLGSSAAIRKYQEEDFEQVVSLDAQAVGGSRRDLMKARLKQSYSALVVEDQAGRLTGFAIGADQRGQLICGPVVTEDNSFAMALVHKLGEQHQGQTRIDIPDQNQELIELLERSGFARETHPPVMVRGGNEQLSWGDGFNAPVAQMFG